MTIMPDVPSRGLARVTRRGKPAGKRRIMGCMEGTAKIVGDIESPAVAASHWEALRA